MISIIFSSFRLNSFLASLNEDIEFWFNKVTCPLFSGALSFSPFSSIIASILHANIGKCNLNFVFPIVFLLIISKN